MTIEAGAIGPGAASAGGVSGRRLAAVDVGGYRVVDAVYTNGLRLPTHTHPRPALSVSRRGSFLGTTRRGVATCTTGMFHIRPSEEPHANQFDAAGTRVPIVDVPL